MPTRKTLEKVSLALLIAGGLVYFVFSTFQDELFYASSCDSTEPANAAQRAALLDLQSRKASVCEGPQRGCQYLISEKTDGTLEITFWNIGGRSGSECRSQDCCYEVYRYDSGGNPLA